MRRTKREEICTGYLTVYLSLIMAVLLALFLALLEGVRSNAVRAEAECVTEIGLNSIMAEYHRELFSQYNLFAIDSSYGTAAAGTENITAHMQAYLERNFSMEDILLSDFLYRDFLRISVDSVKLTGVSIMTDGGGARFRRGATEAVMDDYNLTLLQKLQQWMQVMEDNGLLERDVRAEKLAADAELQSYEGREIQISQEEWLTVHVENPTDGLEQIRNSGILEYVVEDTEALSKKTLMTEQLIASRMAEGQMNKGNMVPEETETKQTETEQLVERFLFQEYLLRYFGYYGVPKEEGALSYQLEYLLGNNDTDVANLKEVVNVLCAIREAANTLYLFSDAEKCREAEGVATLLATLCQVPEAAPLLKTILLFGWAYAESLYDVETLLSGGRIPLLKDKRSWHYDIQGALHYGGGGDTQNAEGLSYADYLRIMMMFVDLDTLTERAMNMVEADVRCTPGNTYFRLDNCFDRVVFRVRLRSAYGYTCEITRKKEYQ